MTGIISGVTDWGFGAGDIWSTVMTVVVALAGFLILGICVEFAPSIMRLVYVAITHRQITGSGMSMADMREEYTAIRSNRRSG
jgi:hypothetical protein